MEEYIRCPIYNRPSQCIVFQFLGRVKFSQLDLIATNRYEHVISICDLLAQFKNSRRSITYSKEFVHLIVSDYKSCLKRDFNPN